MSRFVVDASVVLHLVREGVEASPSHALLSPTLVRSEVLDALYRAARSGEADEAVALEGLARFATMRIRFLGDKVLRRRAWAVAAELGWSSTRAAEYVALAQLQADALVTLDAGLAAAARAVVPVATLEDLL